MFQRIAKYRAMLSVDVHALGRRCCAQDGNEASSGTPHTDVSRRLRRRRRRRTCSTALPMALILVTLSLLRSSDAFAVRSHTNCIPRQGIGVDLTGRFPQMPERAHHALPQTRRRQHGTMPPPRCREALTTLLRSTPNDSPDAKKNGESGEELDTRVRNDTIASTNSSVADEMSSSEASDMANVVETNTTTGLTDDENSSADMSANKSVGMAEKEDVVGQSGGSDHSFAISDDQQQQEENDERLIELRQRATAYVAKLPLAETLRRLDKRGLRYGPATSQTDLEMMLVHALVSERSGDDADVREERSQRPRRSSRRSAVDADDDGEEPLYEPRRRRMNRMSKRERRRQRLDQGDDPIVSKTIRDVARAASRAVQPVDRVVSETLKGAVEGDVGKKAKRVGRRAKRVAVDVAGNVVGGVGEVVDGVKRKGSSIRNGKTRVISVDENGIAEPDWSYVWQDDLNSSGRDADDGDVQKDTYDEATRQRGDRRPRRQRRRQSPRRIENEPSNTQKEEDSDSDFTWADYAIPFNTPAGLPRNNRKFHNSQEGRRIPRRQPFSDVGDEESFDDTSESQQASLPTDGTFLALPPASTDGLPFTPPDMNDMGSSYSEDGDLTNRKRRRNRRSGRQKEVKKREKRKIYSVYEPDGDEGTERDMFDEFGNRFADAAENFLWGDEGNNDPNSKYSKREANARRRRNRRSKSDAAALDDDNPYEEDLQPKRHWRDRLADRLDAAMGVHEQGSYYQEWADRVEFEEDTKVGEDPEDWVMARHKNQRRMGMTPDERKAGRKHNRSKPKRRGGVDTYFWNQDGNIMAALLGRSRSGNNRAAIDELFSQPLGANVITTLIRSGFQLSLALFTNICSWASVRGSLPQPIVVFFAGTSLVLAPKGKRLLTTAITLFALRALAEALHGYIYGPDGWEDDQDHLFIDDDVENDDSGEEYQDDFEPSPPRNRRRRRNSHINSADDNET